MANLDINKNTPFGIAARFTIDKLLKQLMDNLPGTVEGSDIEALHDMRVASRRLRASFRVFRRCFQKNELKRAEVLVKKVTQALGQVRDQDVLIEFLEAHNTDGMLQWLIEREKQIREGARLRMIDILDDITQADLPLTIKELLENVSMVECDGKTVEKNAFAAQAKKLINDQLCNMRNISSAIENPENVDELHQMRIAAKRLRYTMEAFIPCFGKPLKEKIEAVKLLQEQLGEIHDCDVWLDKLEQYQHEHGLSDERKKAICSLIKERKERRDLVYKEALSHWRKMTGTRFEENLIKLVSDYKYDPTTKGEEVIDLDELTKVDKSTKEPKSKKSSQNSSKTKIVEEVADTTTTMQPNIGEMCNELKTTINSLLPIVCDSDDGNKKFEKQLVKLDSVLENVNQKVDSFQPKTSTKLEKWIKSASIDLAELQDKKPPTAKDLEKARENLRSLRKKITKAIEEG